MIPDQTAKCPGTASNAMGTKDNLAAETIMRWTKERVFSGCDPTGKSGWLSAIVGF